MAAFAAKSPPGSAPRGGQLPVLSLCCQDLPGQPFVQAPATTRTRKHIAAELLVAANRLPLQQRRHTTMSSRHDHFS